MEIADLPPLEDDEEVKRKRNQNLNCKQLLIRLPVLLK